ncbi:MAG: alpha-mannosidase, partial [Clostridia bacterium]|nr:alpha-mannosidase [Clostridia bacterium]
MNKIHLIGNAHLDPVWLWQWYEGYAEVKATFRSALDRMKEFPDYKFTSACAAYYEWVRDSDPAMFDEIRARVKEGRWCVSGGWYIQPDCNIPSGESFARHALVSQRFFRREFGKAAKTGYNVDSFGHNGSLPMILRQSGMDAYVFMRPGPHEKPEIPDSLFRWESADGSAVPTYRIPIQYNFNLGCFDNFAKVAEMAVRHDMMAFYGVGNHGGGPTIRLLEKMEAELGDEYVYSTPDEYFDAVRGENMPVVREDLQFHAKGCYSACSLIKKNNRKSESMLYAAENLTSLSHSLVGTAWPAAEFERAWKNTLFNQFHDIMGGCSIRDAYDNAAITHGETQAIADRAINFACQQISWNIDTVGDAPFKPDKPGWGAGWTNEGVGTPIVVFNPHPWPVVRAFVTVHDRPTRLTDDAGHPIRCQL